ncbi:hypothetical protein K6Q96_13445 [Grimontia kaedaensis]|uniref:Uncharacterized protein n=1 Tax=Grimontia kaedaensis TaxID=2872157 RepID=A0ABY4WTE1_9GAMM|nr:hypothetical protein [Grimontia kaedaensis]USH01864.1 hypothetical protein K6Q96_13445 [Grimontia kaedaensis]
MKLWNTLALGCLLLLPMLANSQLPEDNFGGRDWYTPSTIVTNGEVGACTNESGQLYMWGNTNKGSVSLSPVPGNEARNNSHNYPYALSLWNKISYIDLSQRLGAFIDESGDAYFWSSDGYGYYRGQPFVDNPTFVLSNVSHLSVGKEHIVFVKNDGTVWSVGFNKFGNFGTGSTNSQFSAIPVKMKGINNVVRAAAFGSIVGADNNYNLLSRLGTLLLKSDGTVWVSGAGGTLVPNHFNYSPTQIETLTNIVSIQTTRYGAYSLDAHGDVYAWGAKYYGSLGLGIYQAETGYIHKPRKITFPEEATDVVAIESNPSDTNAYAIDSDKNLWAWGYHRFAHAFGVAETDTAMTPIISAKHVDDVIAGNNGRSFLIRSNSYPSDSRLWWTGYNFTRSLVLSKDISPLYIAGKTPSTPNQPVSSGVWAVSRENVCNLYFRHSGFNPANVY